MVYEYAYVTVDVDDHTEQFASSVNGQHLDAAIGHYFVEAPQVMEFEDTAV